MKNHQRSIHAMFGELAMGMRQIVRTHDFTEEAIWHIADVLAHLFTTYVEHRREGQVPGRRSAHPTMPELLAWLDEYCSDRDGAEDAASTSAN
jgi:hypothetical protein